MATYDPYTMNDSGAYEDHHKRFRRNRTFYHREPFQADSSLDLKDEHTGGPFTFLNPTRARLDPSAHLQKGTQARNDVAQRQDGLGQETNNEKGSEQPASSISYQWRSRDNRKGRHPIVVTPATSEQAKYLVPESTTTAKAILRGIWKMCIYYPYWDISWWVAVIFTWGSIVWVINAFFVWLPLVDPSTEFPNEISVAGGWSAWVGATIFEVGSVLLIIEAVNENRAGCFGWALEQVKDDIEGSRWRVTPQKHCKHHHSNKKNFVGAGAQEPASSNSSEISSDSKAPKDTAKNSWQWFPSWHDLRTHYIHELGFLACAFQLFGATVFWISGFTAIPQIQAALSTQADLNGAYWVPQIVGGSGFIASGICFMLETQKHWWQPNFRSLGWHIGFWNLVGAFGFTLCGALGPAYANEGAQFEASLATFWGSWAFLIGSVVQWYESVDTHPVEVVKNGEEPKG